MKLPIPFGKKSSDSVNCLGVNSNMQFMLVAAATEGSNWPFSFFSLSPDHFYFGNAQLLADECRYTDKMLL